MSSMLRFSVIQIFGVQFKDDKLVPVVKLTFVIFRCTQHNQNLHVFLYQTRVYCKTGKYCISRIRIKLHALAKRDLHIILLEMKIKMCKNYTMF